MSSRHLVRASRASALVLPFVSFTTLRMAFMNFSVLISRCTTGGQFLTSVSTSMRHMSTVRHFLLVRRRRINLMVSCSLIHTARTVQHMQHPKRRRNVLTFRGLPGHTSQQYR